MLLKKKYFLMQMRLLRHQKIDVNCEWQRVAVVLLRPQTSKYEINLQLYKYVVVFALRQKTWVLWTGPSLYFANN